MQPPKYGELLMDAVIENMIETDLDFWVESKQREPEQTDVDLESDGL